LRHVALIGEQVVLADFVGFGDVLGLVMEYVTLSITSIYTIMLIQSLRL
jgi:hypothetical protein